MWQHSKLKLYTIVQNTVRSLGHVNVAKLGIPPSEELAGRCVNGTPFKIITVHDGAETEYLNKK